MAPPNLEEVASQVVCESVIDFKILKNAQNTEQMEEILEKIEETGLKTFLSVAPEKTYTESVAKFYLNLEYDEVTATIESEVNGKKVTITKETLTQYFGLKDEGDDVLHYREGEEKELWPRIRAVEGKAFKATPAKGDLDRDYQILLDIV